MDAVLGKFRREGEARATPARLTVQGKLVLIHSAETARFLADAERRDLDVSARIGSIPRQVSLQGGWTFETDDNDGIDRLLGMAHQRLVPSLERFGPHLIVFAIAVVIGIVGIVRFAIPAVTEAAVDATPQVVEEAISAGSLRSLDATMFSASEADEERRRRLEVGFSKLVTTYKQSPGARSDISFRLLFREAPFVGPNALALPDGTIIVTDALLTLIEEDEAILAVLGHEIAHVHHRHSLQSLYRSAGIGALILFLGGDMSQLVEDMVVQGAVLSNLASSRSMEREADVTGVTIAADAGVDPEGLIRALQALTGECEGCDEASWASSHPSFDNRRKAIREAIKMRGDIPSAAGER